MATHLMANINGEDIWEYPIPGNRNVRRCRYCGTKKADRLVTQREWEALSPPVATKVPRAQEVIDAEARHERAKVERAAAEKIWIDKLTAKAPDEEIRAAFEAREVAFGVEHALYTEMQIAVVKAAR